MPAEPILLHQLFLIFPSIQYTWTYLLLEHNSTHPPNDSHLSLHGQI